MTIPGFFRRCYELIIKRPKGSLDFILDTVSYLAKSSGVLGMPVAVTIEPTNRCNLRCPVCETGTGILGRPKKDMTLEEFRIILEKIGRHLNSILLYFMGEPFLNKDTYEMIRMAGKYGIYTSVCTNGEFVDPDKLIGTGLNEISFQIGGITQETHCVYRVGANLEKCLTNLRKLVALKRERKTANPKILMGFIVMKHNENEVPEYLKLAREIGVDGASVVEPCVRTPEQAREMLPTEDKYWLYDRRAFEEKGLLLPRVTGGDSCPWIYYSMTITAAGDVVPCCRDAKGEYVMGNLLRQGLGEIWNGRRFRAFRKSVLKSKKKAALCRLCSGYRPPVLYNGN